MTKKEKQGQEDFSVAFEKPEKPSKAELVAIISFSIALLITLNASISILTMVFMTAGYYMIKQTIIATKTNPKGFFNKLSKASKTLLVLFMILFIVDEVLTWIAVWFLDFALETNGFSVWLWTTFGYGFGEVLRVVLMFILIFIPTLILSNSKSEIKIFISFMFSLTGFLIWIYAIINNVIVLLNYLGCL